MSATTAAAAAASQPWRSDDGAAAAGRRRRRTDGILQTAEMINRRRGLISVREGKDDALRPADSGGDPPILLQLLLFEDGLMSSSSLHFLVSATRKRCDSSPLPDDDLCKALFRSRSWYMSRTLRSSVSNTERRVAQCFSHCECNYPSGA